MSEGSASIQDATAGSAAAARLVLLLTVINAGTATKSLWKLDVNPTLSSSHLGYMSKEVLTAISVAND